MAEPQARLTRGSVGGHLVRMTLPMIMGIFSIVAFNLGDTWFVARLGTEALAAITFTFPVVMLIGSIAVGIGGGTVSVLARTIGEGDQHQVGRITTDSLLLAVAVTLVFVVAGLLTIDPLFRLLGASDELMPLIHQYMRIWYLGVPFVIVPMVGNFAIRATGDTKVPGLIMVAAAVINLILDPLLIFGVFGFPRLEMAGAALATLITRALTLAVSLAVLHWREQMIVWRIPGWGEFQHSCRRILYIGLPATAVQVLNPLNIAIITRLIAAYGPAAVGAAGAGQRIQSIALLPIMALGSILVPFVAQNWGAGARQRILDARRLSNGFSLVWGGLMIAALIASARYLSRQFSVDPLVQKHLIDFLIIIPLGFPPQGLFTVAVSEFNALNRPLVAAGLSLLRMAGLYVPLALLGGWLFGLNGIFGGVALANALAGIISWFWLRRSVVPLPG